jgi:hypothetical protein
MSLAYNNAESFTKLAGELTAVESVAPVPPPLLLVLLSFLQEPTSKAAPKPTNRMDFSFMACCFYRKQQFINLLLFDGQFY